MLATKIIVCLNAILRTHSSDGRRRQYHCKTTYCKYATRANSNFSQPKINKCKKQLQDLDITEIPFHFDKTEFCTQENCQHN